MLSTEQQLDYINSVIQRSTNIQQPRLLLVLPGSYGDIFLASSLLKSIKYDLYPEYQIYFACNPEFQDILLNNPYIDQIINYVPIMDHPSYMEGASAWNGLFDVAIQLHILTQRYVSYHHNGKDRSLFTFHQE